MRSRAAIFLGLGLVAAAEDVATLGEANFTEHIEANRETLVEFYAPWCGHCKKLAPEYEKAATELKAKGIPLAKVDATEAKALAEQYDVKGFPTLIWFESGVRVDYDGGRTADAITAWVSSMTGPPVAEVQDPGEPGEVPQVVLHAEAMNPGFEEAAKAARRKASWYFVKGSGPAKAVLRHKSEEPIELTEGADDQEKVAALLSENSFPLWGQLDSNSFDKYVQSEKGLVWTLFKHEEGQIEAIGRENRAMMVDLAKDFRSYHFTYTDTVEFKGAIENMLGLTEFPALAAQRKAGDKKKYILRDAITPESVRQFLKDLEEGKVKAEFKSEPIPEKNDEPVKVIVGHTLGEVFDKERDVMLEIYAPWCGHCKKLEPEYMKLARKIKKEELTDLVTVAKMDGTANDSTFDSIEWSGFPTMYWIKAGSDKPVLYDAGRTGKDLWRYVKRHATKSEEIKERLAAKKNVGKKSEEL